jgi:hypothetical protein
MVQSQQESDVRWKLHVSYFVRVCDVITLFPATNFGCDQPRENQNLIM